MADETLPHNIEAEQAVLGALMFDHACFWDVEAILSPAAFYDPLHGRIYGAIHRRLMSGALADAVMLKSEFASDPAMDDVGGPVYLAELMRESPEASSVLEYAKIIVDLQARRSLIQAAFRIADRATNPAADSDATDLVNQAEQDLAEVSASLSGGGMDLSDPDTGIDAVFAKAESALASPGEQGLRTGYRKLDRILGPLAPSNYIVLAGRPSMGKTAAAVDIARSVAQSGGKVGFFSVADMGRETLWQRMVVGAAARQGAIISSRDLRTGQFNSDEDRDIAYRAGRELKESLRANFRLSDRRGLKVSEIRRAMRIMQREMGGLDLVVVDYLQRIGEDRLRRDGNRAQAVADISGGLQRIAGDFGCVMLTTAQIGRQVDMRDDKRPRISDLKESGSIEEDADIVILAYRPEYYLRREEPEQGTSKHDAWSMDLLAARDKMELIVVKNRHDSIGTAHMEFREDSVRMEDGE